MKKVRWYSFLPFKLQIYKDKKIEKLQMAIAWKLPRWLVKWTVVRAFANASTGEFSNQDPTMLTYSEVINRWTESKGGDKINAKK